MNLFGVCFADAEDGFVELSIGGVHREHRRWVDYTKVDSVALPADKDVFFGPALRAQKAMGKAAVKSTRVCWVDIDTTELIRPVLPPTAVVWSGHGWHLYWALTRWLHDATGVEKLNSALAEAVGGDSCQNIDRIMRVPGTMNLKDPEKPIECKLTGIWPGRVYEPSQLYISTQLSEKVVHKVVAGDRRGFASRSERDWFIVRALVNAGLDDDNICLIFESHVCGDKFRDPRTEGLKYLEHTIARARRADKGVAKRRALTATANGYYIVTDKDRRRLSTFTIEPTRLLEGENEDSIMCDIRAAGTDYVWKDEVIPVSAFAGIGAFTRRLTKAAWVWLGKDAEVRALQMFLITQLQEAGLPLARAVTVVGRHELPDDPRRFFVSSDYTFASDGSSWPAGESPIVLIDTGRESPTIQLVPGELDRGFAHELAKLLPAINERDVVWPMIGWFMAAPMKPDIERCGLRFPVLNVYGTRGSGKTTTILRVFHPLLGYVKEQGYDANTTRFVMLSLLGSSNAMPIAFSEFRVASATNFTRYILLAYDTGRDPRGRPDQTTVDYPLLAPFSVDGEDMLEDPASLERIVAVRMSPHVIGAGTAYSEALDKLQTLDLREFAGPYIAYTLTLDIPALVDAAEQAIWDAFPESLPIRIRKNLTVVWAGVLAYASFMKSMGVFAFPRDKARVLSGALGNVYSVKLGRAPTAADEFCEFVVNASARGVRVFPWKLVDGVLWFQLMPAFEFFLNQRTRQRKTTLSRGAIRTQLLELVVEYTVEPCVMILGKQKALAYGVNLVEAHEAGLDVPTELKTKTIIFEIG